jgi:tape measure domain-containing protein
MAREKLAELAIDITVDGLPQVEASTKKVESLFDRLTDTFTQFAGPAALAGAVAQFVRMADAMNAIDARLTAAVGSGPALAQAQTQVFEIAQRVGISLESSAELFARIKQSTKDLGVSQGQVAIASQAIADAFKVGGASAAEQAAAALQLSQALGSGRLQGDELRSILEASRPLAEAIAREFGVSVGHLKELGAEGALTSDRVFKALLANAEALRDAASKIPDTVAVAWQKAENAATSMVAALDRAIGGSALLVRLLNLAAGGMAPGGLAERAALVVGGLQQAMFFGRGAAGAGMIGRAIAGDGGPQGSGYTPGEFMIGRPTPLTSGPYQFGEPTAWNTGGAIANASPWYQRPGTGVGSVVGDIPSRLRSIETSRMADTSSMLAGAGREALGGAFDLDRLMPSEAFAELRVQFSDAVANSLVTGFSTGIAQAIATGDIGEGFKQLSKSLAAGLGQAMVDFGTQTLLASKLMETIRAKLASFLPGGGVTASLLMIAAGSAMIGLAGKAARRSFGGGALGGSLANDTLGPADILERGILGMPSRLIADGRDEAAIVGLAGRVPSLPSMERTPITIIGQNDPKAQRELRELIRQERQRVA